MWQKAHNFVLRTYAYSEQFPTTEQYGLTSQLRRAAVSIPANIAEGFKRQTKPDKARLMNIAQGSLAECQYYLILANDMGYGETTQLQQKLEEVSKLLDAYIRSIQTSS